jgi:small subunit ribosomal protein S6
MRQSRGKEIIEFPMRHTYELTFIVRVDPNEEVINNSVTQVQGWVEANELGQVTKIDRWGRRKLAYEIDKQRDGYYVCMNADIDPQNLPELERNLKLSTTVLRYLLIRPER